MLCVKCGVKKSTGFLIQLCDDCFDQLEKNPSSITTDMVDPALRYQSSGGLIPDHVPGVKLRFENNDVRVDW